MNDIDIIEQLTIAVEQAGVNLAPTYQEYMPLAFAVGNSCGEAGRGFFHRLSYISITHYSEGLAVYLVARKNKRRKNARALPPALLYKGVVLRNFGVMHKNIAYNLLCHGVCSCLLYTSDAADE